MKSLKSETKRCCFTAKFARNMSEVRLVAGDTVEFQYAFVLPLCGSMEMNCSLSLLFAQLREEMETEVGQALFAPRKQN